MLEQEVPHQKLFDYDDILADEEAYDNDALRRYESKDFGSRVFNTAPLRFGGYGDPPLVLGNLLVIIPSAICAKKVIRLMN